MIAGSERAPTGPAAQSEEGRKLAGLVDEVLEHMLEVRPEMGTFLGHHQRDHLLGAYTADSFRAHESWTRKMLGRVDQEIDRSLLASAYQIDYDLLRSRLETELWLEDNAEQKEWERDPAVYLLMPTAAIHAMTLREYAPVEERLANILKRAEQLSRVLRAGVTNLRRPPKLWTEMAIESAQGSLSLFEDYLPQLFAPLPDLAVQYDSLKPALSQALGDFVAFLQTELLPRSDDTWVEGAERFNYRLRHEHFMDEDAEALIAYGNELLAASEAEISKLAETLDPERAWQEIIEQAKRHHPPEDSIMEAYRDEVERARTFVHERDLVTLLPGERARVVETPPQIRTTIPYAAYDMPPLFGEADEGIFYVTTVGEFPPLTPEQKEEKLRGHSYAAIEVTTVHETYPGHHVQLVHMKNAPGGVMRKLAFSTVLVEGWALYCEELMHESGYYSDERVRLMQLKDLVWRACRVIVDASIHTGRMSFDEAVDFLIQRAALERTNAIAELKRYTQSPTQPMSYAVGRRAIFDLREQYRSKLGKRFDLKAFHDSLLSYGSIAPSIIAREMIRELHGEPARRE